MYSVTQGRDPGWVAIKHHRTIMNLVFIPTRQNGEVTATVTLKRLQAGGEDLRPKRLVAGHRAQALAPRRRARASARMASPSESLRRSFT